MFPPIPDWQSVHPLVIHFPIALLLVAPVFIVIAAAASPAKARPFLVAALVLLVLGTAGAYVAVETGEAAARVAGHAPQIKAQLERHEDLAELTRNIFTALTVVFAGIVALPLLWRRAQTRWATTVLPLLFLLAYGGGAVVLANTAHQGGRLVHEFGVKAMLAPAANSTPIAPQTKPSHNDRDD